MISHLPKHIPNLADWRVTITDRHWNGVYTYFVDLTTHDHSYLQRIPFTARGPAQTYFQELSAEILERSHKQ